jgi:hypothetical protein
MIETNDKLLYEAPAVEVVEIKSESCILQASRTDYSPVTW